MSATELSCPHCGSYVTVLFHDFMRPEYECPGCERMIPWEELVERRSGSLVLAGQAPAVAGAPTGLPVTIRPTTNSMLGDQDSGTFVSDNVDNQDTENPLNGTNEFITAQALNNPSITGTISSVRFGAYAYNPVDGGASTALILRWRVGANMSSATLAPSHIGFGFVYSAAQATKPGGGAWTLTDVNALTIEAAHVYNLDELSYSNMIVAELFAEVS